MATATQPKRIPRLRQSFLSFPTISRPDQNVTDNKPSKSAQPASELPPEVWNLILKPLSTIALKSFRLVCREWSRVGTSWLYQTAFLDPYGASWIRLHQLSNSEHAHLVTRIVWHPLRMHEECLDGEVWRALYPNMLRGLSHSQSIRLHDLYRQAYGYAQQQLSDHVGPREGSSLANFKNCSQLLLEDDLDIESSCADPYLRKRIQNDQDLLERPAVWGKYPRWWALGDDDKIMLASAFAVLQLPRHLPSITQLKFTLWDQHLYEVIESLGRPRSTLRRIPSQSLHLVMKFNSLLDLDHDRCMPHVSLSEAFAAFGTFADLHELTLETRYMQDGQELLNFYEQQFRGEQNDSNDSDSTSTLSTEREVIGADELTPTGPVAGMYNLLDVMLTMEWVQMPSLTHLTLCNLALDTRALIAWLCNQSQIPQSGLTIRFQGQTILYGLKRSFFMQILAALKITLVYDCQNLVYYETDFLDISEYEENGWFLALDTKDGTWDCEILSGLNRTNLDDAIWDERYQPLRLPKHDKLQRNRRCEINFVHRPQTVQGIARILADDENRPNFFYCARIGSEISFEWFDKSAYFSDLRAASQGGELHPLLMVHACNREYYGEQEYDHEEQVDELYHISLAEQEDISRARDEADLQTYEGELLRLDVQYPFDKDHHIDFGV